MESNTSETHPYTQMCMRIVYMFFCSMIFSKFSIMNVYASLTTRLQNLFSEHTTLWTSTSYFSSSHNLEALSDLWNCWSIKLPCFNVYYPLYILVFHFIQLRVHGGASQLFTCIPLQIPCTYPVTLIEKIPALFRPNFPFTVFA